MLDRLKAGHAGSHDGMATLTAVSHRHYSVIFVDRHLRLVLDFAVCAARQERPLRIRPAMMRDPLTTPADAFSPDADRAGPDPYAHAPRRWRGSADGVVRAVAREAGAVATGSAVIAGASGAAIGRSVNDGQQQYRRTGLDGLLRD